jgi:hypothetical protein
MRCSRGPIGMQTLWKVAGAPSALRRVKLMVRARDVTVLRNPRCCSDDVAQHRRSWYLRRNALARELARGAPGTRRFLVVAFKRDSDGVWTGAHLSGSPS